ncbi:MAG TPA: N-acetylneuraminate synthase family protein, partial [Methanosarcinales archaeon]|nr:N-acetylneuraminate synthase family protein [Methanosarcinales archaeon]
MANRAKIIAEIGWNHMGDMNLAKKMIDSAKECGADYAKFQTWSVKNLKLGPWDQDGRREIYEKAELTIDKHKELKSYCDNVGIKFL